MNARRQIRTGSRHVHQQGAGAGPGHEAGFAEVDGLDVIRKSHDGEHHIRGDSQMLHRVSPDRSLIEQRFGTLPTDVDARVRNAEPKQVRSWILRLHGSATLDDVFAEPRSAE